MNAFSTIIPDMTRDPVDSWTVTMYYDPDAQMWCATCDDIPIATESKTVDALIERVWQIAPEIAQLNGLRSNDMRLRFVVDTQPVHA